MDEKTQSGAQEYPEMNSGSAADVNTEPSTAAAGAEAAEAPAPEAPQTEAPETEAPETEAAAADAETLSPEAAFAEAMMADTRPAEDLPIEELPLTEKPVRAANPEKKERTAKIVVLSVLGVVLTALLVLAIVTTLKGRNAPAAQAGELTADEVGEHSRVDMDEMMKYGPFSYSDESLAQNYNAQIAAKVGDHELTNGLLQIFYWSMVYQDLNENADYISYRGPDTEHPFAEQKYDQTVNWEQHYLQTALDYYLQNVALYDEAVKNGTELSEESRQALDNLSQSLTDQASAYGFDSVEDYLAQSFGPGVTIDDYLEYYRLSTLAYTHATKLQQDIALTDAEIEEFYDKHAEEYAGQGVEKLDQNVVNVRHILIMPEKDVDSDGDEVPDESSDDAWETAEGVINELYEEWKKDPTEDNFAEMATTSSHDTGSAQNGGLYENIYPGQMVEEFADWCFDPSRAPGDTGIVRTAYGYHLMYFSSEGDRPYWQIVAESECKYEKFNDIIDKLFSGYELEMNYDNVHLFDTIAANAAKNAEDSGNDPAAAP